MGTALSTEYFVTFSKKKHKDLYDYSKVAYKPGNEKITIICKKHGEFLQNPHNHMTGQGCPKCGRDKTHSSNKKPISKEIFIEEALKVHGDKYNYSKVGPIIYSTTKVIIVCKKHGEFLQQPCRHLQGHTCFKCSREIIGKSLKKSQDQFLKEAVLKHKGRYDYYKSFYISNNRKIVITCKKHGEFLQSPLMHLQGNGCPKCHHGNLANALRMPEKEFISRSEKAHNNKYDYSKVVYINISENVIIKCPVHGYFLQPPVSHLRGHGCPACKESKGEKRIAHWLKEKNMVFNREKIFKKCKCIKYLRFDFYLPEYNTCIEYDGPQHSVPCSWFGGREELDALKRRDKIKEEFCEKNVITLIRIPYTKFKFINIILERELL